MTKSAVPTDVVTFTEVILNGKLHFLCRCVFYGYEYTSVNINLILEGTQLAITCSKLTIETLKQGVKY